MVSSSAAIEIKALSVALRTIFKVNTELRNNFIEKKLIVNEVGYPDELDMKGSTTVVKQIYFKSLICSFNNVNDSLT